jgi:hypothetical protein
MYNKEILECIRWQFFINTFFLVVTRFVDPKILEATATFSAVLYVGNYSGLYSMFVGLYK